MRLRFFLSLESSHRKALGHHETRQQLDAANFRFFQRTMLGVDLSRELIDEVEQELVVSTTCGIVVDSQKDAMCIFFRI